MSKKIVAKLKQIEIFSDVSEEALEVIVDNSEIERFKNEEIIFNEGDESDKNLYVIINGTVAVLKSMRQGEREVGLLKEGKYFGEFALFSREPRQATIEARETTTLLKIPFYALESMKKEHSQAVFKIYENMFRQLAGQFRAMADKAEKTQFWFN